MTWNLFETQSHKIVILYIFLLFFSRKKVKSSKHFLFVGVLIRSKFENYLYVNRVFLCVSKIVNMYAFNKTLINKDKSI